MSEDARGCKGGNIMPENYKRMDREQKRLSENGKRMLMQENTKDRKEMQEKAIHVNHIEPQR